MIAFSLLKGIWLTIDADITLLSIDGHFIEPSIPLLLLFGRSLTTGAFQLRGA